MSCLEKSLAIHRNKIGIVMTKFITTRRKLTEGIFEMEKRTRPIRLKRKKSPDSIQAGFQAPGFLRARAVNRLNNIE